MVDATPTRRSGRARVSNKKYLESTETLELLNTVLSSDSEEDLLISTLQADPSSDKEFPANDVATHLSSSPSSLNSDGSFKSDGSAIATPVEDFEDAHSYGGSESDDAPKPIGKYVHQKPKARNQWEGKNGVTRSRGIAENPLKVDNKSNRSDAITGPDEHDVLHVVHSMRQWGDDPTLPRRSNMRMPFSHDDEKREMEATVGWDWYYEQGGREAFAEAQKMRGLGEGEGTTYLPKLASHDLLMGPYERQKLFSLPTLQSLNVDDAWNAATDQNTPDSQQDPRKRRRHGWMLNVGSRVRCLDWVPNDDGDFQYLAMATQGAEPKPPARNVSAFAPASPSPSNIQIWAFASSPGKPPTESPLDQDCPPKLKQVLCVDWGNAKQLKWCPMPRIARDKEAHGKVPLGLLAGVWDDGSARVLDVELEENQGGPTAC
ncbi:MAG: hypothetical protein Q9164_004971, partial [Protoblastenia rupestris]